MFSHSVADVTFSNTTKQQHVKKKTNSCNDSNALYQWFPTCGVRIPGGTRWTGWGYAKIILVMAENTKEKKGVKIKTQKQSYEVLVYKERHVKVVSRPAHHRGCVCVCVRACACGGGGQTAR
jgi:hypothetical protein